MIKNALTHKNYINDSYIIHKRLNIAINYICSCVIVLIAYNTEITAVFLWRVMRCYETVLMFHYFSLYL